MVATRSRAPAGDVDGGQRPNSGTDAEEAAATAMQEAETNNAGAGAGTGTDAAGISRTNRRASTKFSLETPVTDLASTDEVHDGGGGGSRGNNNITSSAAGVSSRSKPSRTRTSLERLPQPHAGTPETPPRRSARSNAGIGGSHAREGGGEDQAASGAARQGRNNSSSSRGNAELKSLLGLDAAVSCCVVCDDALLYSVVYSLCKPQLIFKF